MVLIAASPATLVLGVGRGAVVISGATGAVRALDAGAADERCVAVACSADGATVVTAADSKIIRCWVDGVVVGEATVVRRPSGLAVAALENQASALAALVCCAGELWAHPLPALDRPGAKLLAHTSSVLTCVAMGAGVVATADRNEKVRLSRFPQCAEVEAFCLGHSKFVAGVAFAGATLASAGGDGEVRLWNTDGECLAVRRPTPSDDMVDIDLGEPSASGYECTAVAACETAVAVGLRDDAHVHVFSVVAREGGASLGVAPVSLDLPAPPADLCFRGETLCALVPGHVLCAFERGADGAWAPAAAPVVGAAVAAAAAPLGQVAPSGLFLALDRKHDHQTGPVLDDGLAAVPPAVLKKHQLESHFDPSRIVPDEAAKKARNDAGEGGA